MGRPPAPLHSSLSAPTPLPPRCWLAQWPILAAPLIPLYGLLFPKNPRLRIGLQAATGAGGACAAGVVLL